MKIDEAYILKFNGLQTGKHRFDYSIDDAFFGRFEGSEITAGHADISVDVDRQSNMLALGFHITGGVTVACDRCLGEFEMPVDYEGTLIVRFAETPDEGDGDIVWLHPTQTEMDLSQYIFDSIGLSLPLQKVHPEDENGHSGCDPEMLARFRTVSEDEFEEMFPEAEEEDEPNPEWQRQLKALKEKLEKDEK